MSRPLFTFLAFLLLACAPAPVHAKRSGPARVEPMIREGVRYSAPNEDGRRGVVRASDAATDKLLWEQEIFTVTLLKDLETDVQWVFIKSLRLEKNKLIILATNNQSYSLDLKTREVVKLKQASVISEQRSVLRAFFG